VDDSFYRAFFAMDHRILGKRIRPYCLGHALVLEAINSPFVSTNGNDEITPEDCLIAIKVLGMAHPFAPNLKPSFWDRIKTFRLGRNKLKFRQTAMLITAHIAEHRSAPKFWKPIERENKGGGLTAPWLLSLLAGMMRLGYSEREVLEMSMGRLLWIDAAAAEREGADVKFFYEDELEDEPEPALNN
jgi:hypothetical protein